MWDQSIVLTKVATKNINLRVALKLQNMPTKLSVVML